MRKIVISIAVPAALFVLAGCDSSREEPEVAATTDSRCDGGNGYWNGSRRHVDSRAADAYAHAPSRSPARRKA